MRGQAKSGSGQPVSSNLRGRGSMLRERQWPVTTHVTTVLYTTLDDMLELTGSNTSLASVATIAGQGLMGITLFLMPTEGTRTVYFSNTVERHISTYPKTSRVPALCGICLRMRSRNYPWILLRLFQIV